MSRAYLLSFKNTNFGVPKIEQDKLNAIKLTLARIIVPVYATNCNFLSPLCNLKGQKGRYAVRIAGLK